jgi:SAM-dependent methyltransferase
MRHMLGCPDMLEPLQRSREGALCFPNGEAVRMRGARPVLLPSFARSRIVESHYQFSAQDRREPAAQYLYLSNIKANGGDQNSAYDDIWYKRHVFRTRRLTHDAVGTLLDVGCDTPDISRKFFPPSVTYAGLEPSLSTSDQFCLCGMAEFLPFKDASLDNAALLTSLDHVLDHNQAVDEIFRVLKPGGCLYLASLVWQRNASLVGDTVHFHHFREWEIKGLLKGLTLERVNRYGWKGNDHRYGVYLKARKNV